MASYEGDYPFAYSGGGMSGGLGGLEGILGLLIIAGLFGGNGGLFGGGGRGQAATQADLSAGFANSSILSGINDLKLGQASMQNWINQGFSGLNLGVERGFAQTNFNLANGLCEIGHQISDCCCQTQRSIDGLNYNNAKNTCDIIQAINYGNQRVIDYMQNEKICAITAENVALKGQISNYNQTNAIVNAIKPCPVPAYTVPNPNCCYNGCGGAVAGFSIQ